MEKGGKGWRMEGGGSKKRGDTWLGLGEAASHGEWPQLGRRQAHRWLAVGG